MADMQKNLPCALEAEQSVLGSILIDPNCFADLTEIIHADDFYLDEHGEIFYAMQDLFAKSREIDLVTLIDTLVSRGVYNEEESKKYIKVIAETVPSAANVLDYAKIVREKSLLRSLIGAADEIREMLTDVGFDLSAFEAMYGKEKIQNGIWFAKDLKDRYTVLWMYYDLLG